MRSLLPAHIWAGDERGGITVITALFMVGLLGLLALSVDLSILLANKQELVNAADAAALAGVQELPASAWNARGKALEYGARNGLDTDEMVVEVSAAKGEVTIVAQRLVNLFFAPVLGIHQASVAARSRARVGTVAGIGGVVPLSVRETNLVFGEQYFLKAGPRSQDGEGNYASYQGNYGCLALGGRGASNYREKLMYGYTTALRVGDVVETEPGNMAGPTAEAVAWRTERPEAYGCSFDNLHPGCPQLVIVPVVTDYEKGGRGVVTIVGFAAFFLEGTTRHGAENFVLGRFVRWTVDGEVGDSNDFGLRAYRLVE